jgi:hypothetical protein
MPRSFSTEPVVTSRKTTTAGGGFSAGDVPGETVKAAYAYEADSEVELTISEGDLLTLVSRSDNAGNTDWLYVEDSSGQRGYVPKSYVVPVSSVDGQKN